MPYSIAYNYGKELIILDWFTDAKINTTFDEKIMLMKVCNVQYLAINFENGFIRIYDY